MEQAKETLWWIIYAGICLIVILPLIGDYGLVLFPLGRDIIFRIIIEIIFFVYLLLVFIDCSFLPKMSGLFLSLIVFWFISGLATIFSLQPSFSFWGNPFRGHGFFSQTHYLIFFLILTGVLKTWQVWKKIIWLAIIISLPVCLISFFEVLAGAERTQSTLNNPNFLAAYLLLIFFITLVFLLKQKRPFLIREQTDLKKLFLIVLLLLQFFCLTYTSTRGAYIGFAAGLFSFFFFFVYLKLITSKKQKVIFFSSLALLVIMVFLILVETGFIGSLLNEATYRSSSIKSRLESYRTALLGIKANPWLGIGPENFVIVFDKYYQGNLEETGYVWFDKVHNIFLEVGVTTGILGLLAYLAIWFFAFKSLIHLNLIKIALLATFVAYLGQNLFNIDTTTSFIYLHLWLGLTNFLASKIQ